MLENEICRNDVGFSHLVICQHWIEAEAAVGRRTLQRRADLLRIAGVKDVSPFLCAEVKSPWLNNYAE